MQITCYKTTDNITGTYFFATLRRYDHLTGFIRQLHIIMGLSTSWTLDPDSMWIGDPDPKTNLPPQSIDPDPSCVLQLRVTVRQIQSSSCAMRVCVPTLNPDRGSGSSESDFSVRVKSPYIVLTRRSNLNVAMTSNTF